MVPFDTYSVTVLMFVIDKTTNESAPITIATGGQEASGGFVVSSYGWRGRSTWIYDSGTGPTAVAVNASEITFMAKRSLLARAFMVCLLIINSALTLGSVYVTLLAVIRGGRVNDAILFFPVTIVLTIPALRSLYPGSPQFGIYLGRSQTLRY